MIKDNQTRLNRFHVVLDAMVTALSYLIAWYIVIGSGWAHQLGKQTLDAEFYFAALIFIIPGYLLLYTFFNLYTPKRVLGRRNEFGKILKANTIGLLIFGLVLYLGRKNPHLFNFSQRLVVYFYVVNVILITAERNAIRIVLRSMRSKGYNQKHVLLVGYSDAAEGFIDRVRANPEWGYQIRGILDDNKERGTEYNGIRVIGCLDDLNYILEQNSLDEIAITLSLGEYERLRQIVNLCEKSGVHTKFIPDYGNIIPTVPYTEDLLGMPVVHIRHVPLNNMLNSTMKRIVDIFGALVAIVLFSPIMIVVAITIKLTSPGPIIFCQERVGLHNRPFKMYKFRSMTVQDPNKEKTRWTTPGDSRVTPIGKIIRSTSIDETPQFFNVLFGDMSLVGPRPERPFFVEKFKEEIPRYMIKHQVRPGITGWAQVNGYRGDTSIIKRIEHDLYYIENWSLGFDFKILFLTVFKGFINKNAY
ncbi:MAG: undecaprenyl-phosphate glucose phosphotransferase [Lachnospiraceae bacterium]|nr:undecaprenyl-phosphate glucose phosphotransferase [Lachnospiraceae bacterium]